MATRPIDPYWVGITSAHSPLIFTPPTDIMYHPEIDSRADLAAVNTYLLPLDTVYLFNAGVGDERIFVSAELQSGAADPADSRMVAPNGYDAALNNKHWLVTGGLLL